MTDPSKPEGQIADETKHWFGDQMQQIAIRHDLAGPDISLVGLERYQNEVAAELHQCALAAYATGSIRLNLGQLNDLCDLAAEELIRLRQIRQAHSRGNLPTAEMQRLPVYQAFPLYLDEDPELVRKGLLDALAGHHQSNEQTKPAPQVAAEKIVNDSEPRAKFSAKTEQWLEIQLLAFAIAEDMQGHDVTDVDDSDYIAKAAPCFRNNIQRALAIGDLSIQAEETDSLCRHAAAKALKLRRLKASFASGKISRRKLKLAPEYRTYREYLEQSPKMAFLALQAAVFEDTLYQRKNAKTN